MNRACCTICSDLLTLENCCACPCGHTFHYQCILTWKNTSSTCPQCRKRFTDPIKIYFDVDMNTTNSEFEEPAALKNRLTDAELKLSESEQKVRNAESDVTAIKNELVKATNTYQAVSQELKTTKGTNDALKKQLSYLERFKKETQIAQKDAAELKQKLEGMRNVEELVKGERNDVEAMLRKFNVSSDSLQQITTSFLVVKKEFEKLKETKRKLENERKFMRRKAEEANQKSFDCMEQLKIAEADLRHVDEQRKSAEEKVRKLEEAFSSNSPRTFALKRLLKESPAPLDLKRAKTFSEEGEAETNGSLLLFSDDEDRDSGFASGNRDELDEENVELASEFGLQVVGTTSISSSSNNIPQKEVPKVTCGKSKLPLQDRTNRSHPQTDLIHVRKGYNGLGGQTKILVPSTKIHTQKVPAKNVSRKVKIPKSTKNCKNISSFLTGPPLPQLR